MPTPEEFASKVRPAYRGGDLVVVIGATNQVDAEFIQGVLLEEGIPSVVRRARGVDVPDMLVAGRREILVPSSALAAAREILPTADVVHRDTPSGVDRPLRIAAGLLIGIVVVALVLWLGVALR